MLFAKKPLADYSVGQVVTGKFKRKFKKRNFKAVFFDVGAMVDAVALDWGPGLPAEGEELELVLTNVTRTSLHVAKNENSPSFQQRAMPAA